MAPHRIFLMCGYFPCRCRKKWNVFRVWCDVWWVCISTKWSRKEGSITSQLWCYSDTAGSPGERRQGPGPSAMLCFRSQEMRFSLKWLNVKTLNWLIYIHQDIEINTTILFVWSLDSLWLAASWPRRMGKSKKPFMALKGYWAFYVCLEPVFSYLHENQGQWNKYKHFIFLNDEYWWVSSAQWGMPGMEEMTRVTGEPSTRQLQGLTKHRVIMFVVDITDNRVTARYLGQVWGKDPFW